MRPEEYLAIVGRRWWLLVLSAVVAGLVAFGYTSAQPPTYQVTVRLMAVAQPPDYWLDLYAKNRLGSYQDMIRSWDFVAQAIEDAGLDIDPGHAMSTLALGRNQDSNLVQIVVTDTDPARAAAIANAVGDAFVRLAARENERVLETFGDPAERRIPGTVQVVKLDAPGPPGTPIGPRVRLNSAAGVVLGLAFGVVLAFGVEYFEDRMRSERDVQRYLALGTIGRIGSPSRSGRRGKAMGNEHPVRGIAVLAQPASPLAEAYRALRATIQYAGRDRPVRSVLVAAVEDEADGAVVAANLAAALALAGERVALVDADLRTPRMHTLLGVPGDAGLADWLLAGAPAAPVPVVETAQERLTLVPAGRLPASHVVPADVLTGARLGTLLERLRQQAEYVVVHTAALPTYGDALAVAPHVDGVVLLVRSGRTRRTAAQAAKQSLDRVGACVLGAVLLSG